MEIFYFKCNNLHPTIKSKKISHRDRELNSVGMYNA